MCRPKGYVFCTVLVWKWVYTLAIVRDLESVMVFEETTGVYERIYRFNSKWIRKKEKYANSKWILIYLFCQCSNLSNWDDIIS